MKSLKELCIPRDSIFDIARRDTVLNLSHLTSDKIDPKDFFEENYVTEGMKTLLTESFRRMQRKSEQAVFKLTQAMGGGKTHNLITLGMLAKHPEFRTQVLKDLPSANDLPPVRVVAFSGRETDEPNGIWGEIARQLGKESAFKVRRAARKPSDSDDLKTVCVFGCQSRRTAPDDWSPSMG